MIVINGHRKEIGRYVRFLNCNDIFYYSVWPTVLDLYNSFLIYKSCHKIKNI